MKLKLVAALLLTGASTSFAAVGYFDNGYVVANGGTFHQAYGTADGFNPQLNGGFGSLTQGSTFNIQGFEVKTFESNGSEFSSMTLNWTIDNFTTVNQITIGTPPTKTGNNRTWQITSDTQNLLTNNGAGALANGPYTFQAYWSGATNGVDSAANPAFQSNFGANYTAGFTVVPEPSAALLGALGSLLLIRRRR